MNTDEIIRLLRNSGLQNVKIEGSDIVFTDPSCIYPAFDTFFNYAWIAAMVLTAIILFGWGILYIKNGAKINSLFNNAKSLFLMLCVLSVAKPIAKALDVPDLASWKCETKRVSLSAVQELNELRKKKFAKSDEFLLYEDFHVIDSGAVVPDEPSENY